MSSLPRAALLACLLPLSLARAGTLFVDAQLATGAGDGSSWANAFQGPLGLQAALAAAVPGTEIWVADGTYTAIAPGGPVSTSFVLRDGVALLGGFAGGEPDAGQRDPAQHVARLSGDVLGNDAPGPAATWLNAADNTRHLVRGDGVGPSARLDGFTLHRGHAEDLPGVPAENGGNLRLVDASPVIARCLLLQGYAQRGGGGAAVDGGEPLFEDCEFRAGRAWDFGGGVMVEDGARPIFERCTFAQNLAGLGSGVMIGAPATGWVLQAPIDAVLRDCTLVDNGEPMVTSAGPGLFQLDGTLRAERCVFDGNRTHAGGGGAYLWQCDAQLLACDFSGNEAQGDGGGALVVVGVADAGLVQASDCRFTGNNGVAVVGGDGRLELTNCTLVSNNLGAPFLWPVIVTQAPGTAQLRNCIVRDHLPVGEPGLAGNFVSIIAPGIAIDRSCVESWDGSLPGSGNFDLDPLFADADGADGVPGTLDDDHSLLPGSPCLDASDHAWRTLAADADLAGAPRFVDRPDAPDASPSCAPLADLGALERAVEGPWTLLGAAKAGVGCAPHLSGTGSLLAGSANVLGLSGAPAGAAVTLVVGLAPLNAPFKGGTLVPAPQLLVPLVADGDGSTLLLFVWPGVPAPVPLLFQAWIADASASHGLAASNGLRADVP